VARANGEETMNETNEIKSTATAGLVERRVIRGWEDVNCQHAFECFNSCRYGKGCFEDDLNSAMGGKPWQECHCMTDEERTVYNA